MRFGAENSKGNTGRLRRRRLAPAAVGLALLGSLTLLQVGASAQSGGGSANCTAGHNPPCVMMIQIDGLEAADVRPQTTPFLWTMAHPNGDGNDDGTPEAPPIDATPVGADRNGWIWEA